MTEDRTQDRPRFTDEDLAVLDPLGAQVVGARY